MPLFLKRGWDDLPQRTAESAEESRKGSREHGSLLPLHFARGFFPGYCSFLFIGLEAPEFPHPIGKLGELAGIDEQAVKPFEIADTLRQSGYGCGRQLEAHQASQISETVRQGGQKRVEPQVKFLQVRQLPETVRQGGQMRVAPQGKLLQVHQLPETLRQGGQLVAKQAKIIQSRQLPDTVRQSGQWIYIQCELRQLVEISYSVR